MLLDLKFSIGTLGLGAGTLLAGLYGMNLKNYLEENDLAFVGISGSAIMFSAFICMYGLHKLRRTQRLTMWGEAGTKGKGGWLSLGRAKKPARLPVDPGVGAAMGKMARPWPPLPSLPPVKK